MASIGLLTDWIKPGAVVPVEPETVRVLLEEVKRTHKELNRLHQQIGELAWAYGEAKREALANRLANQSETSGSPMRAPRTPQPADGAADQH